MKKFECSVCHYVAEGEAPAVCPVCKQEGKFVEIGADEVYEGTRYKVSETKTEESEDTVYDNAGLSADAVSIAVENNQGAELPSTGGIGTTIFYTVGAMLVLGAGIVLVSKRRMNA